MGRLRSCVTRQFSLLLPPHSRLRIARDLCGRCGSVRCVRVSLRAVLRWRCWWEAAIRLIRTYSRYGVRTNPYRKTSFRRRSFRMFTYRICRQALPLISTSDSVCINAGPNAAAWGLIVQAGLNDIDRRCDSYLAWLDDRRRTNNAALKELADVTVASQAIMRVGGVGANPITLRGSHSDSPPIPSRISTPGCCSKLTRQLCRLWCCAGEMSTGSSCEVYRSKANLQPFTRFGPI